MTDLHLESDSQNNLAGMLAGFDFRTNKTLPAQLLEAAMNGECPHVTYNSTTARSLPKTVTSSMTLDDEHVDAIESMDPEMGKQLRALVQTLSRHDPRLAPYNIPTLHIERTGERIYYNPVTGERIERVIETDATRKNIKNVLNENS